MLQAIKTWWEKPVGQFGLFVRFGVFWGYAGMFIAIVLSAFSAGQDGWASLTKGGLLAMILGIGLVIILLAIAGGMVWFSWRDMKRGGYISAMYKQYQINRGKGLKF